MFGGALHSVLTGLGLKSGSGAKNEVSFMDFHEDAFTVSFPRGPEPPPRVLFVCLPALIMPYTEPRSA
jgi:hypothetical protein